MNNANFGFNCKNNDDNVTFEPIIDETNETSYIKKYYSSFDTKVSGFVNSDLLEEDTEQTFQQRLAEVKYNNHFRNARITAIENQNKDECDALKPLKRKKENLKGEYSLEMLKQNWTTLSKIKKLNHDQF